MNAELNASITNAESTNEAVASATAEPAVAAPRSATEVVTATTDARTCEDPPGPPRAAEPDDDHEPPPANVAAIPAVEDGVAAVTAFVGKCLEQADAVYPEEWEAGKTATFVGHCKKVIDNPAAWEVHGGAIVGLLKNKSNDGVTEAKVLLRQAPALSVARNGGDHGAGRTVDGRLVVIDQIVVPEGRRPIDRASVNRLGVNIDEVGLLHPVVLTKDFRLVAGRNRLAACKELGWETVPATILAADDELLLRLAEYSENFFGTNLSKFERIETTAGYVCTLEQLGEKQKSGRRRNHAESAHFPETMDEIAEDLGMAKRTVQEYVRISDGLSPEVKKLVRADKLTDSITVLLELAKVTDPAVQLAAANDMACQSVSIETAKKIITRHSTPVQKGGGAGSAGDPAGHTEEAPHTHGPAEATASLSGPSEDTAAAGGDDLSTDSSSPAAAPLEPAAMATAPVPVAQQRPEVSQHDAAAVNVDLRKVVEIVTGVLAGPAHGAELQGVLDAFDAAFPEAMAQVSQEQCATAVIDGPVLRMAPATPQAQAAVEKVA